MSKTAPKRKKKYRQKYDASPYATALRLVQLAPLTDDEKTRLKLGPELAYQHFKEGVATSDDYLQLLGSTRVLRERVTGPKEGLDGVVQTLAKIVAVFDKNGAWVLDPEDAHYIEDLLDMHEVMIECSTPRDLIPILDKLQAEARARS